MDPLTVVGTVASVCQLAQAALSLSVSIYSLASALSSASEDLQILADDLGTFSQSLTLLSRLLEDSRCWYTDDIYLLTAKIIRDCAELYVKIDKILEKLKGNGKSKWKLRMKFVYKEGQIRKLLWRLRDMKGTLATILMSLQVDLQLSLLNISSSSRIQREPDKPLQRETLNSLNLAQQAVEAGGILLKHAPRTESNNSHPHYLPVQSKKLDIGARTTAVAEETTSPIKAKPETDTFAIPVVFSSMPESQDFASIKTSSSVESFKSALYSQVTDLKTAHNIKAMQEVMHAFQTALHILENLIARCLATVDCEIHAAARNLERSLVLRSEEINKKHTGNYLILGDAYINSFTSPFTSKLHEISRMLTLGIVIRLHSYSTEHEVSDKLNFENLSSFLDDCSWQTTELLDEIFSAAGSQRNVKSFPPVYSSTHHDEKHLPSENSDMVVDYLEHWLHQNFTPDWSTPSHAHLIVRPQHVVPPTKHCEEAPEMTLPFIGYTFKRFDTFRSCDDEIISTPTVLPQSSQNIAFDSTSPCETSSTTSCIAKVSGALLVEGNGTVNPDKIQEEDSGDMKSRLSYQLQTQEIPAHKELERRSLMNPAINILQGPNVWWQAYISLMDDSSINDGLKAFPILKTELKTELNLEPGLSCIDWILDRALAQRVAVNIGQFNLLESDKKTEYGIERMLEMQESVIKIVQTVDQQMGLDTAALGWSLVLVFLTIYKFVLTASASPIQRSIGLKQYTYLQSICGIIARYTVMENLYLLSSKNLTINPQYQERLEDFCLCMLRYFAASFILGRLLARDEHDYEGIEDAMKKCDNLMQQIEHLDKHCRRFQVLVEKDNWSESDEGLDDGEWEEISDVEIEIDADVCGLPGFL